MKKSIPFCCFFFCCFLCKESTAQMAAHEVQLNFKEILKIEVAQSEVVMTMNSLKDYLEGSASEARNHLVVTSFGTGFGYEVQVQAMESTFLGSSTIPVSAVEIEADLGSNSGLLNEPTIDITTNRVELQSEKQTLFSYPNSSIRQGYHVKYFIPTYKVPEFLNRDSGEYSTTVIYTIMTKENNNENNL